MRHQTDKEETSRLKVRPGETNQGGASDHSGGKRQEV